MSRGGHFTGPGETAGTSLAPHELTSFRAYSNNADSWIQLGSHCSNEQQDHLSLQYVFTKAQKQDYGSCTSLSSVGQLVNRTATFIQRSPYDLIGTHLSSRPSLLLRFAILPCAPQGKRTDLSHAARLSQLRRSHRHRHRLSSFPYQALPHSFVITASFEHIRTSSRRIFKSKRFC